MAEVKPPRPRNVLVAEFPGLSKDDASQALRDAGGDLGKARKLVKKKRGEDVSDSDDDVVIGDTIASDAALARQLQAELNGEGRPAPGGPAPRGELFPLLRAQLLRGAVEWQRHATRQAQGGRLLTGSTALPSRDARRARR